MKHLEHVESEFNDVDVWQMADGRIDFDVTGATHATWHPELLMTGHAWDAITAACLFHPGRPQSLCMLGLGGATVLRQLRHFLPECRMLAIEIDGDMIRLARDYMDLDALHIEVRHQDAAEFLDHNEEGFDLLIDDLYGATGNDVERPWPITAELIQRHARQLNPQGCLAMNFVIGKGHQKVHQGARRCLADHFGSLRAVRPPHSHNEVLVASQRPKSLRLPKEIRAQGGSLKAAEDRQLWEELRTLKLL